MSCPICGSHHTSFVKCGEEYVGVCSPFGHTWVPDMSESIGRLVMQFILLPVLLPFKIGRKFWENEDFSSDVECKVVVCSALFIWVAFALFLTVMMMWNLVTG